MAMVDKGTQSSEDVIEEDFAERTIPLIFETDEQQEALELSEDPDFFCGFGSCRPRWLQQFASPKLFVFLYSICSMTQGAQLPYLYGSLYTLEKRFSYDTKISGMILIADELGPIFLGVLIGYFGRKVHGPRLMATGMLIGSLSCFVMTIPYFVYGTKRPEDISSLVNLTEPSIQFCNPDENSVEEVCEQSVTLEGVPYLGVGEFLKGISSLIYFTIGTIYVDESVRKNNSPLYLAFFFALRLLGPAVGFLLSSFCLQFYEDPFYDPGFSQTDQRWIGAWWLGFIILGVALLISSFPIALFPRKFPVTKRAPEVGKQKPKRQRNCYEPIFKQIEGLGQALKRLATNPILIFQYTSLILRYNGILGFFMLISKYMEIEFQLSASKASLCSGPPATVGMVCGVLTGGYLLRKYTPRPRLLTAGLLCSGIFYVTILIILMFISCPSYHIAGPTDIDDEGLLLENSCNFDCSCTTEVYTPICGLDGKSDYFSPCFAGCLSYNETNDTKVYTDCKCLYDDFGGFIEGTVTQNYCNSECKLLITFIATLIAGKFMAALSQIGDMLIILRCVDSEDKSVALGVLTGLNSLLVSVPGPLIFGSVIDSSCLVWEENCGKTGNCWVYDTDKFRYMLHGMTAAFCFGGCIADFIVFVLSPRLKNFYDDEELDKEVARRIDDELDEDLEILRIFEDEADYILMPASKIEGGGRLL